MTPEEQQATDILKAIPWRCFHCDFITSDPVEAMAHFGDRDDAEEFTPLCKWWASVEADERINVLQDHLKQLEEERRENNRLRVQAEALEYQVESQESAIRSYKPFRQCASINDVFNLYDSMEGRALAAEEKLKGVIQ